jgi:YcxB-like protein
MAEFEQIEGPLQLDKADYAEAFGAIYSREKYRFVSGPAFVLLGILIAIQHPQTFAVVLATVCVTGGFLLFFETFRHIWAFPRALEITRRTRGLGPLSYRITSDDIEVTTQVGSVFIRWAGFARFIETPRLFVIVAKERAFYIVPKRNILPDRLRDLRQLLLEKLPPPPRPR